MRGPAPVAQKLYQESDASREMRMKVAEERKAMPHFEATREGKPSKRDRREIGRLRGPAYDLHEPLEDGAVLLRGFADSEASVRRSRGSPSQPHFATWWYQVVTPCPWR